MLERGEREGRTTQKEETRKRKPLEVELDLGGAFPRGNMLRPSIENGKEAHLVSLGNFKQQEDVEIYQIMMILRDTIWGWVGF